MRTARGSLPLAPTNLAAVAISGYRIWTRWTDNATDETGYMVEARTSGTAWRTVATLPANTTVFTHGGGVLRSTRYYYRVRAVKRFIGYSAYSNTASAVTRP